MNHTLDFQRISKFGAIFFMVIPGFAGWANCKFINICETQFLGL